MSSQRPRQQRRSGVEVRKLVLAAAHDLFTEHGYHQTRTKDIADRAGVGESVLFRNFGSKAELFEEVVLAPFGDFLTDWAKVWDASSAATADPEDVTRTFVRGFYGFAQENKDLLLTLLSAQVRGEDESLAKISEVTSANFAEGLRAVSGVLIDHSVARGFVGLDMELTVAAAAANVLAMVLMEDWLFAADHPRPDDDRRREELVQMLLHGIAHRTV